MLYSTVNYTFYFKICYTINGDLVCHFNIIYFSMQQGEGG